jgi:hypothetical protein
MVAHWAIFGFVTAQLIVPRDLLGRSEMDSDPTTDGDHERTACNLTRLNK